ncbi:2-hydroxyacylsphingosine 1-beta-galactosyltransferase-like 1 [Homarus americanus]|uniref:UDP-glucuronosyltransferase n=2 Tax=Homarus americanus TaxID=6706 RepID=A0A8J5K079_HOMAM|nr:2-hydroxyacylsphingosine 1-beta-galactosyltransferase-like 1 [Homarus americanus]
MKVATLCVLVAALTRGALGVLSPPERSYKILILLPVSTRSHRIVFMTIAEALADRGHKVVMLINQPKSSTHPNIHEVAHGLPHRQHEKFNMFDMRKSSGGSTNALVRTLPPMARDMYQVPEVKELYERRKEFDVVMVDALFNEAAYPFVHELPFILVSTSGIAKSDVLGNVLNPAYTPSFMFDFPSPMSAWHRFLNTLSSIVMSVYWRHWAIVPLIQKEISAQFPELPPLLDLERNMSLALLNSHFTISKSVPLLPSQVEVGAMHCRPANPLPQELESWITGAGAEGVIYFSLGSVARGNSMPVQYRNLFLQAFRRLPQRVIWKYEGELEDVPDNVMISKWLPQQDILAHDNVKVFITHGGLLSLQESIYHVTPLLALPIFGDQPKNGRFVRDSGLGHFLVWEELTEDLIVNALTDIISDPKYKENVMKMSAGLRDQLISPKELAVFWTEYVIRHRGAPQLRSPAAQLSWVEFLMLDVLLLLHLALLVLYFTLRRVLRAISAKIFGSGGSKKKKD